MSKEHLKPKNNHDRIWKWHLLYLSTVHVKHFVLLLIAFVKFFSENS